MVTAWQFTLKVSNARATGGVGTSSVATLNPKPGFRVLRFGVLGFLQTQNPNTLNPRDGRVRHLFRR